MKAGRAELAYELYNSLGEDRTYAKVAELMDLSVKTIEKCGSDNKWQERIDKEYKSKSEEIRRKREELEGLGLDVAITSMGKIKSRIEADKLDVDLAKIYEVMLKSPLSVCGLAESVKVQSADATSNADNSKLEVEITVVEAGGDYED